MAALTACSVEGRGSKALSPGPAPSAAQSAAQPGAPSENGPAGVSAGGVTTRLDIPAESTEEQYAQACLAAKDWMDSRVVTRTPSSSPTSKICRAPPRPAGRRSRKPGLN